MRIIALDTETTGLRTSDAHRIIEIGAIDICDNIIRGEKFHQYINPQRAVDERAAEVHGFTYEDLKEYPVFESIHMDFLEYLEGAEKIIIHNADFDLGFLIYEYSLLGLGDDFLENFFKSKSIEIVDTLKLSRELYPGRKNSLDALCKRFDVDAEDRVLHGALLDAKLLAQVYLSIIATESQCSLFGETPEFTPSDENIIQNFEDYSLPVVYATEKESSDHEAYMEGLMIS